VHIVSPQQQKVKAWNHEHWTIELPVDVVLSDANPNDYDALMIPGGVINPDQMRVNKDCVNFAAQFLESGKPVGAICHGPQLLIETGMLRSRRYDFLSFGAHRPRETAGAQWTDREVVVDHGLVTSRSPKTWRLLTESLVEEIMDRRA
jgi:protease I